MASGERKEKKGDEIPLVVVAGLSAVITGLMAYIMHRTVIKSQNQKRPKAKSQDKRNKYLSSGSTNNGRDLNGNSSLPGFQGVSSRSRSAPSSRRHSSNVNGVYTLTSTLPALSSSLPVTAEHVASAEEVEDLEEVEGVEDPDEEEIDEEEEENQLLISALQREKVEQLSLPRKSDSNMARSRSVQTDLNHFPEPLAAAILRKEPETDNYIRMHFDPADEPSAEESEVCFQVQECLKLREKYVFREKIKPWEKSSAFQTGNLPPNEDPFKFTDFPASKHHFAMVDGVVRVYADDKSSEELYPVADSTSFFTDMYKILKVATAGAARTICHKRLLLLEKKFQLHIMLNSDKEHMAQKSAPHRDFYNVRKVDTHVHHSACMNQKHLLRFIKSKLRKEPDEVVIFRDGKYLTLREVFESLDLTGYDLNIDLLDMHADKNTFHRFDKFNLKYNPCGQSRLREIFIKQENLIQGRFLAEVTQEVFSDLGASKYQMAEYRISIYGRKKSEWDQLASWVVNNKLYSNNVVWLIQLPRLYQVYREMGIVRSFQQMLDNVFLPLFEVTVDPSSHPQLHVFLQHVVGFDMVDDESKQERKPTKHMPTPQEWDIPYNPPYAYWTYYVYANLYTLNKLRECRGMSIIKFRPHSGEAGDIDHLAATFLAVHNIAHGNNLRKNPVLQYFYYLAQIGLAMSPLSNNSLFLDYHKNPFPTFFYRGLNVSLSTDDPLMIHLTKEPLVEEYSVAKQVWKFSSCDICEIARNSVYQSGFSHEAKAHWLGEDYFKKGPDGNNIHKSNVPHVRVEFRDEVWKQEMNYIYQGQFLPPREMSS